MKHAIAALMPLLVLCAGALEAKSIDETVAASATGSIHVENVAGSIELIGWDRNEVSVTGELGDDVEDVEIDTGSNRVSITVVYENKNDISDGADLVIRAPAGSRLDVKGVSADVSAEGFTGSQRLVSVSGDIRGEGVSANAEYKSVSGDVSLSGSGGDYEVSVKTVSGDLRIEGVGGEVEAKSVSGDVIVEAGNLSKANIASTSGDIELKASVAASGRVEMKTISGDAELLVGDAFSGEISLKTASGDIENCFGPEARERDFGPGASLSFVEGDGDGELRVSSMSGDVELCR